MKSRQVKQIRQGAVYITCTADHKAGVYRFTGGKHGEHTIAITSPPARVQAHWRGYVDNTLPNYYT